MKAKPIDLKKLKSHIKAAMYELYSGRIPSPLSLIL